MMNGGCPGRNPRLIDTPDSCSLPTLSGEFCILHDDNPDKDSAAFEDALRKHIAERQSGGQLSLVGIVFPKVLYRPASGFPDGVSFTDAKFHCDVDLYGCQFGGQVSFEGAEFLGKLDLSFVEFEHTVSFQEARFGSNVDLYQTVFRNGVSFEQSTIEAGFRVRASRFDNVSFTIFHCPNFKRVRLLDGARVIFDGDAGSEPTFLGVAEFKGVEIDPAARFTFRKISLERCLFSETDVSRIAFVETKWPVRKRGRSERKAVGDETLIRPGWLKEYCQVAYLYQKLQVNYLQNYRYHDAADFYVGEQLMSRKAKINPLARVPSHIYEWLADFGVSYVRPFLWLLLTLAVMPMVLLYDKTDAIGPDLNSASLFGTYDWSWSPGDLLFFKGDYWDAFWANICYASFNRGDIYVHLSEPYQQGILTLETIWLIVLVTFFVLALRRAFRRKSF